MLCLGQSDPRLKEEASLIKERQRADADTGVVEHDNRSGHKKFFDHGQLIENQVRLLRGAAALLATQQHNRRFGSARACEQLAEVRVRGNQDAIVAVSGNKHDFVGCTRQTKSAYVD